MIAESVAEDNRTVILSSHNLSDIETLCDSVCLIDGGEVVLHKSVDDIVQGWNKYQMILSKPLENLEAFSSFATLPTVSGKLITFISSLDRECAEEKVRLLGGEITYSECVPLTLDEIFTLEVRRMKEKRGA